MFSRYAIVWECICERRGWDSENDGPGDHWDELDYGDKRLLEQLWWDEGLH